MWLNRNSDSSAFNLVISLLKGQHSWLHHGLTASQNPGPALCPQTSSGNSQLSTSAPNKPTILHPVLIKNGSMHQLSMKNTILSSMKVLRVSYFEMKLYKHTSERGLGFVRHHAAAPLPLNHLETPPSPYHWESFREDTVPSLGGQRRGLFFSCFPL